MSKERARRRAAREAEQARQRSVRARRAARRRRIRGILRAVTPRLPRRRTARLGGRSRVERAGIVVGGAFGAVLIWLLVDDLALRVALFLVLLLALPAIVVIALGRRT
ncbi:hypothetical protein [Plantactinospora sp. GCM10030261]|uniref:hypothetical protein n=1 Tax=Plantactinospora sp. GCM10030261 TaxID=3273420 RepID=UPI003617EFDF